MTFRLVAYLLTGIYLIHLCLKFAYVSVPTWMSSYLADFLCLPFLLSWTTLLIRKVQQNPFFSPSFGMILFTFLATSIVFEWYLPSISSRYTSDSLDVVMYASGGVFFYFFKKANNIQNGY